jgi:hypothetical protein
VQYVQTQTAEKMEGLTKCTYSVGVSAQKEAIVMRIITVVTLFYLPATFVSVGRSIGKRGEPITNSLPTFFSTDVVKYQLGDTMGGSNLSLNSSGSSFSELAMNRWLQVSLPLTAITIVAALLAYQWAKRQRIKDNWVVLDEEKVLGEQ